MTLDSTVSLSMARGNNDTGQVFTICPEEKFCPVKSKENWCYLFTHRTKVDNFVNIAGKHFNCFVHKTVYKYHNSKKDKGEILKPTISGLIFIQGNVDEIKSYLRANFSDFFLAKDCCTQSTAVISDDTMQPFMRISESNPTRIRVLLNPIDKYSEGRSRVRFTSGIFRGCEGYIVRMNRDRKLVMQMGNMTLAVGNIQREQFENIEETALPEEIKERLK